MALKPRPRLVLLGDSITQQSFSVERQGWGAALADLYQQKVDVINRGASGYNTRWTLPLMESLIPASEGAPLATIVFFGANDAVEPGLLGTYSRQHVPVDEYEQNLVKIVAYIRQLGCQHIYIGAYHVVVVVAVMSVSLLIIIFFQSHLLLWITTSG